MCLGSRGEEEKELGLEPGLPETSRRQDCIYLILYRIPSTC